MKISLEPIPSFDNKLCQTSWDITGPQIIGRVRGFLLDRELLFSWPRLSQEGDGRRSDPRSHVGILECKLPPAEMGCE